ncbi:hypothetical protein N9B92_03945 [Porticoccaceae bacterium]|nr:hypothetical protein [Porticoccaceae bacterium]
MCGIFGVVGKSQKVNMRNVRKLAFHARQRGIDASGLVVHSEGQVNIIRADAAIDKLLSKVTIENANLVLGHSRLVTNGFLDNQPVYRDDLITIHNGIIVNCDDLWIEGRERRNIIDSEIIPAIFREAMDSGSSVGNAVDQVFRECEGVVSAAIYCVRTQKIVLLSNNGSLYFGYKDGQIGFSSEEWPLVSSGFEKIANIVGFEEIDLEFSAESVDEKSILKRMRPSLVPTVPEFLTHSSAANGLVFDTPNIKRCTKCILPETMPYIHFDDLGVCNYCQNYVIRNKPKPLSELADLVEPYRRKNHVDCIVPFSGGRDSCMALHLIQKELKMKSVTYTYDWGMVTDLGRRNISRMCAALGVENIIIAADIEKKRRWIKSNLTAWLNKPHLGMMSLLTAGDKHFFRYVEQVKKQTQVSLNIWGVNPLEVTHFKSGFLGVPPSFEEEMVYSNGFLNQLSYQGKRFKQYMRNPGYINSSIYDTLSGEYWRSVAKKQDYYHIFDYYSWDEAEIDGLLEDYGWETSPDTPTTWRIGDGTAAFYNYVYHTVAGFSEHDTFRSNQIREGAMSREKALELVQLENQPRYPNIKWYLEAVGLDYKKVIDTVNAIPKLYVY